MDFKINVIFPYEFDGCISFLTNAYLLAISRKALVHKYQYQYQVRSKQLKGVSFDKTLVKITSTYYYYYSTSIMVM